MYNLNPALYGSVFVVPGEVVDKYIKLASFCAIKTLLWILKNRSGDFSVSDISKGIGSSEADVNEALDYWVNEGVLVKDGESAAEYSPVSSDSHLLSKDEKKAPANDSKADISSVHEELLLPTYEQVAVRMDEDRSISDLINQIQIMLGRSTGYDMNARILQMIDGYGFEAEIILRLIQYCIDQNKTSNAFILSVAKNWYKNEIFTLEQADAYIDEHGNAQGVYNEFRVLTGLTAPKATPKQEEFFIKWHKLGISVEMMVLAYNTTIENTGKISFAYMDKVLVSWNESGYKNPDDVEKGKQSFKEKQKASRSRSYDIDKAIDSSENGELVYTKKKKNKGDGK